MQLSPHALLLVPQCLQQDPEFWLPGATARVGATKIKVVAVGSGVIVGAMVLVGKRVAVESGVLVGGKVFVGSAAAVCV